MLEKLKEFISNIVNCSFKQNFFGVTDKLCRADFLIETFQCIIFAVISSLKMRQFSLLKFWQSYKIDKEFMKEEKKCLHDAAE